MQALKIIAEGLVTSFRYPHFVQGVQPTFAMPPPATIYGHVCSAVGEWIGRDVTQFAYHFTATSKFFDFEHLHFFGKDPKMNPFNRELLFQPRLTLYLSNVDLKEFFLRPHYPVVLGRSQDLMTYVDVHEVTLQLASETFYSDTLIPLELAAEIGGRAYAVTMPRFLDEQRVPSWGQYAILHDPVVYPGQQSLRWENQEPPIIWVDPEPDARHPSRPLQRGIIWHSWV